jgi:hypothetical protein
MEYEKLRLDVLQKLIDERGITCKNKKEEIIKYLKMDDEGKYMYDITYERTQGGYFVGIDIKDHQHLIQMSKFIEKGEARRLNRYENNRIMYFSSVKLM